MNPATLFFQNVEPGSHPIQGALCPTVSQNISISSTSAISVGPFNHPIIRVVSDTDCYILLGNSTVTAAVGNTFMPAGAIEYFYIQNNGYLAAVTKLSNASGTLNVTEMS